MPDELPELPESAPDGHLRVSDRERDETLDLLADAATDGRLTLDEYSERADRALVSRTRAELTAVTHDLAGRAGSSSAGPLHERVSLSPPVEKVTAIFGSETRRGRWPVPEHLRTSAWFGECTIDLQEASLRARLTVVDARATFGSVQILVPDGVDVRMTGMSVFGSRTCHVREASPGAPVVEVRGRAIFGEVSVRRPRWRDGVRKVIEDQIDRYRP